MESNLVTKAHLEQAKTELVVEIERVRADMVRWVAGLLVAQAVVVIASIKLL